MMVAAADWWLMVTILENSKGNFQSGLSAHFSLKLVDSAAGFDGWSSKSLQHTPHHVRSTSVATTWTPPHLETDSRQQSSACQPFPRRRKKYIILTTPGSIKNIMQRQSISFYNFTHLQQVHQKTSNKYWLVVWLPFFIFPLLLGC